MKTLTIVIPVYNEEKRLSKTFTALESLKLSRGFRLESILFVNDGSQDNTKRYITLSKKRLEKILSTSIKILNLKTNSGKGAAVRIGMLASTADYTLIFDADVSTPLAELSKFFPYMRKNTDLIIGTRKNGHSTVVVHQPLYREVLGKGFTFLTNTILNTKVTDFTCGFKAISRSAKQTIFSQSIIDRWAYDAEIVFLGCKYGFTLVEVPVVWINDKRSKVRLHKDLPQTLVDLAKIKLSHSIRPTFPILGAFAKRLPTVVESSKSV